MAVTKLLLLSFALMCLAQVIRTDYIAAVVEYQPINGTIPNETIQLNLQEYVVNIELANKDGVQIIVFPEYGLTGIVADPNGYAIEVPTPGENSTFENYFIQILSNAAASNNMYVVVNLLEMEKDANNNTLYYNTNIVFDKAGKIVAKYRKINLFQEPALTPGPHEQNNTFTTDFGVTFGTFVCYDITYYNPSVSTLAKKGVTDIVYPTAWISHLPFYHSLSVQAGYAAANKVNLLAADHNAVSKGIGGSGIYGADGTVYSYYISGTPGSKLLKAVVSNAPDRENTTRTSGRPVLGSGIFDDDVPTLDDFKAQRFFLSEKYEFRRLNLSQINLKEEVCHRSFCCLFTVNVSEPTLNASDIYQILAFKGTMSIQETRNIRTCALVACESPDVSTCAFRNVNTTTKFDTILVETNVPDSSDIYYQPSSLSKDLLPAFNATFNFTTADGNRVSKYFVQNIQKQNLIAFGFTASGGVTLGFSSLLLVALMVVNYFVN